MNAYLCTETAVLQAYSGSVITGLRTGGISGSGYLEYGELMGISLRTVKKWGGMELLNRGIGCVGSGDAGKNYKADKYAYKGWMRGSVHTAEGMLFSCPGISFRITYYGNCFGGCFSGGENPIFPVREGGRI